MKNLSFLIVIVIALNSFSCKNEVGSEIEVVTTEEMQAILKMDQVQLVDVRTPEEFSEGYIKNAQNIDYNSPTFEEDILKLNKQKPVMLYCHSGGRSAKCAQKLKEAGFKKIYDLKGGISKWKHDGLAIEK